MSTCLYIAAEPDLDRIINPATGLQRTCPCSTCAAARWGCSRIEHMLTDAAARSIEAGLAPDHVIERLAATEDLGARTIELATGAIAFHAGHWLSVPRFDDLLKAADRVVDDSNFGFHIGTTIPGWFERWIDDQDDGASALDDALTASEDLEDLARRCEVTNRRDHAEFWRSVAS